MQSRGHIIGLLVVLWVLVSFGGHSLGAGGSKASVGDERLIDRIGLIDPADRPELEQALAKTPYPVWVYIADGGSSADSDGLLTAWKAIGQPDAGLLLLYNAQEGVLQSRVGDRLAQAGVDPPSLESKIEAYFRPTLTSDGLVPALLYLIRALPMPDPVQAAQAGKSDGRLTGDGQTSEVSDSATAIAESGTRSAGRSPVSGLVLGLFLSVAAAALLIGGFRAHALRRELRLQSRRFSEAQDMVRMLRALTETDQSALDTESWRDVDGGAPSEAYRARRELERYIRFVLPEVKAALAEGDRVLRLFRLIRAEEELAFVRAALDELEVLLHQATVADAKSRTEAGERPPLSSPAPEAEKRNRPAARPEPSADAMRSAYEALLDDWQSYIETCGAPMPRIRARLSALGEAIASGTSSEAALEKELEALRAALSDADAQSEAIEFRLPQAIKAREARLSALERTGKVEDAETYRRALQAAKARWDKMWPLWADGDLEAVRAEINAVWQALAELDERLKAEEQARRGVDQAFLAEQEALEGHRETLQTIEETIQKLRERLLLDEAVLQEHRQALAAALKTYETAFLTVDRLLREGHFLLAENALSDLRAERQAFEAAFQRLASEVQAFTGWETEVRRTIEAHRARIALARQNLARAFLDAAEFGFEKRLAHAAGLLDRTLLLLDHRPIAVSTVESALKEATTAADAIVKDVDQTIDDARRAESIIARLNRFRLHEPDIGRFLMQAENCYRDRDFAKARAYAERALSAAEKKYAALP
ncbi:MAG: hypothetical protein IMW86_01935 [Hydrogenibacillus sp.]|nr:hypothetical protein [Hydrogenibacillus sp.]